MSLDQYSPEQIKEMSMLEVGYELFLTKKDAIAFQDLVDEIAKILNLSKEQVTSKIAQFYTDLNVDGRFITLGENRWGLRTWYPYEQIDEEVIAPVKPKKKKAKKKKEDDIVDFDEIDEDDLEYDDLDELDDDDIDDVDDEEEDEDFDEIDEEEDEEDFEDEELLEDDYDLDDDEELEDEEEDEV
ncbi:DNA-directed RNA polymerase subunit delta [Fredinandcohnia quinoae]|uniref:Probable DNA-directed RNA polymerase subunit delta n=1 Tax=Fredinandcohnia quinoae TaxID=2918902 RepID=A0AAW5EBP7_9BACI|nr:DNA-directed RNA polymerase subunit delta [Fredinandcohnia sp. SECRCQ15]MCH1626199.1 DNA-directed RNA polymerase subunit delta [Fredinandcohnia sp. SECRCQ15]